MAPGVPRRVTWRRLPNWPYPDQRKRPDLFQSTPGATMDMLESEVKKAGGSNLTIGAVIGADQVYLDGTLKSNFRTLHPGIEVSFEHAQRGTLTFHTAVYPSLYSNMRAIAKALEALRAVDRYGITETGEQYAGWAALPPGEIPFEPDPELGQRIAADQGGLKAAIKALHPDRNDGVTLAEYQHVMAYKEAIGA